MKISELRQLISNLIKEELNKQQSDILAERNKQNKAMKDKIATQQGADRYSSRFLAANPQPVSHLKKLGRDAQKGMGTGTKQNDPRKRPDMKTMMSDPLQRRAAGKQLGRNKPGDTHSVPMGQGSKQSTAAGVPSSVKSAMSSGGKVVFGKYFDSSGKYLGRMQGGKWVDASKGNTPGSLEERNNIIRLQDLVTEVGKENRISTIRLVALLEKCMGELKNSDEKKIAELLSKVLEGVTKLNEMPYNYNTMSVWQLTQLAEVELPVKDLREKLNGLLKNPSAKLNVETIRQAVKALDELYIY